MANRMDLMTARSYEQNGETKTAWTRIGTAWSMDRGGWRLTFDAMPIPTLDRDGKLQVSCLMMEPKPRDDQRSRQETRKSASGGVTSRQRSNQYNSDLEDDSDVPF